MRLSFAGSAGAGDTSVATAAAIFVAVIVYFVMVFVTKALTREEISLLPKGETIYKIAVKLRLAK